MTYLGFLALFLLPPLIVVSVITLLNSRRGKPLSPLAAGALLAHVALAVTYTTPWDNYLVAARVWWYDPARVLGLTLGWVPLEEYLFFVLQTLLTGLLVLTLLRHTLAPAFLPANGHALRMMSAILIGALWLTSVVILIVPWKPGTYLALEFAWALPPIALQLAVGADILWRQRRVVLATLMSITLYLCAADFLAIGAGVWTIDPAQSLNIFIGGFLPIEEVFFFWLTNSLVVFGLTLALAPEMRERGAAFRDSLQQRVIARKQA